MTEPESMTVFAVMKPEPEIAAMLREEQPAGSRVLLLYPAGLDFVAGFLGCVSAGMVAVPAYPPDPVRWERGGPRLAACSTG